MKAMESGVLLAVALSAEGDEGFAGKLTAIGLSDGKRAATVAVRDFGDLLSALAPALSDAARKKAVHNSKLLQLQLAKHGIALGGVADDPMLYSYLLEPLASSHALADVVLRRQGRKISPSLAEAAQRTHQLSELLRPEIAREQLRKLYGEIELPLARRCWRKWKRRAFASMWKFWRECRANSIRS